MIQIQFDLHFQAFGLAYNYYFLMPIQSPQKQFINAKVNPVIMYYNQTVLQHKPKQSACRLF